MRALLIDVDFRTGLRAGGISPHDPRFPTWSGWFRHDEQLLGQEVRLVPDDALDLTLLQGVEGVTVLEGRPEIDAALKKFDKTETDYSIDPAMIPLMVEHVRQTGVSITDLSPQLPSGELARRLHEKGVIGTTVFGPREVDRVGDVYDPKSPAARLKAVSPRGSQGPGGGKAQAEQPSRPAVETPGDRTSRAGA